jgi:hypothetical protein
MPNVYLLRFAHQRESHDRPLLVDAPMSRCSRSSLDLRMTRRYTCLACTKMRIVRSSSASACILFAFFVDYFSVPPVRIAKFPIAVVLRSILCMALWSPAVSSCRSQALLHGLAVERLYAQYRSVRHVPTTMTTAKTTLLTLRLRISLITMRWLSRSALFTECLFD